MTMRSREMLAFFAAPISFGLLLLVLWSPYGTAGLIGLGVSLLIGYPIAFIIGVPVYLFMKRIGANGLGSYSLVSLAFAALLIGGLIVYPAMMENSGNLSSLVLRERLNQMAFLVFGSFFTVLIFWLIARPDKIA